MNSLPLSLSLREHSAAILQNGVSIVVNAQESSSRISRHHVRQIYALFGGDISVDLYLVRTEGFWEKHVEPCAKSQTKGEVGKATQTELGLHICLNLSPSLSPSTAPGAVACTSGQVY